MVEKDTEGTIEFLDKIIEQHNQQIEFISKQLNQVEMTLSRMSQLIQQGYPQK